MAIESVAGWVPEPVPTGAARAAIRGAALAFPVVFVLVTVVLLFGGAAPIEALGVAAFVSFWAGPAFGGLFGAVTYLERISDAESPPAMAAAAPSGPSLPTGEEQRPRLSA